MTIANSEFIEINVKITSSKLNELNYKLKSKSIRVLLIMDLSYQTENAYIANEEVLKFLTNCTCLTILVNSTIPLSTIENLSYLDNIKYLELLGNIKKTIDFTVLKKFTTTIEHFSFEWGVSKPQQNIINEFENLSFLNIRKLDLEGFSIKKNMFELKLSDSLLSINQLNRIFPSLAKIDLQNCRGISDFDSVLLPNTCTDISLRYVPQLINVPKFHGHPDKIEYLVLYSVKNLRDISQLVKLISLKKIVITDLIHCKAIDFVFFKNFKQLSQLYITFKDHNENLMFKEFCLRHKFQYGMITKRP